MVRFIHECMKWQLGRKDFCRFLDLTERVSVSILGGSEGMLLRENWKFRSSQMAGNASKISILVIQ